MNAKATTGNGPKGQPKKNQSARSAAIDAALAIAAAGDWAGASLADVADKAGLSLVDLYGVFPSKASVLAGIGSDIDKAVLEAGSPEDGSMRDRLFELLMRRFDVLEPDRDAVCAMIRGSRGDVMGLICLGPHFARSMAWMLEAAGVTSSGPRGCLAVKALGVVQLATLKVWMDDDSDDLSKTMKALDANLGRLESLAGLCEKLPKSGFWRHKAPSQQSEPRTDMAT